MKENHFIYADLSALDLQGAKDFYSKLFNWTFHAVADSHCQAMADGKVAAGIYDMPSRFKEMGMPSFWMSYIQVDNIDDTVQLAKNNGGRVEVIEETSIGKIALIRDPLGAGFTVYQGDQLGINQGLGLNTPFWNELYVSDFDQVKPFYTSIFDWSYREEGKDRYTILDCSGRAIGAIQEVSNSIKGKKEYWGVYFKVDNLSEVENRAKKLGGRTVYRENGMAMLTDPFGAVFHISEEKLINTSTKSSSSGMTSTKWKPILGIALIMLSLMTEWYWIWGVFFAIWVYLDIKNGTTHMFETVKKSDHPILYWTIVMIWAGLSVLSLVYYSL